MRRRASIHEILLPKVERLTGEPVTVTGPQAAQARPWDPDGVAPGRRPTCKVYFASQPPKIEKGFDDQWWRLPDGQLRPEMIVLLDGQRLGSVRAMYDDKNLYLAYMVRDAVGPANRGSELPYCPFVSGAYVDFCVAPNWSQPQREEVLDGDVRVVLARVHGPGTSGTIPAGRGEQDFQQGFWQRKAGGKNPQTIVSPAARIHFDHVGPMPGLRMIYHVGGKDAGLLTYEVLAELPLASLGLSHPGGRRFGFDASIAVANAAGDRRERAGHWGGASEGVVVDRPGSAAYCPIPGARFTSCRASNGLTRRRGRWYNDSFSSSFPPRLCGDPSRSSNDGNRPKGILWVYVVHAGRTGCGPRWPWGC